MHVGLGLSFWDFGSSTADRSRASFEILLLDVLGLGSLHQKHPDALFSGRCTSWQVQYFQTGFLDVPASSFTLLRQPFPSSVVAAILRPAVAAAEILLSFFRLDCSGLFPSTIVLWFLHVDILNDIWNWAVVYTTD